MNSKELVEAVFSKKRTGRIPVNHRSFSSKAASYILGREAFVGGGVQSWREVKSFWEGWHDEYMERSFNDAVELALVTGQDLMRAAYFRQPLKPTAKIDEHTYLFEYGPEEDWQIMRYCPESEEALMTRVHQRPPDLNMLKRKVEEIEEKAVSYTPGEESFSFQLRAMELYGKEKEIEVKGGISLGIPLNESSVWMEAMVLDPGIVKAGLEARVELAKKNIAFLSERGFRVLMGGGDFASERGPMFSPGMFRDFFLPGLKEISDICHKHGSYHLFASDGNLWQVADALFDESGIDGYYEIDRKAGMDLAELRKRHPGVTLLGNISSWTLSRGSREDVKREVMSCLDDARQYGGIIVGVSNQVQPETPKENIDVMLDLLVNQNRG